MVSLVLVGLTVVALTFGWLFVVVKYAGAVYWSCSASPVAHRGRPIGSCEASGA